MRRIRICDEGGSSVAEECDGPLSSGRCSRAPIDGPLPCAGRTVTLSGLPGGRGLWLKVEEGSTACPVAALGIWAAGSTGARRCALDGRLNATSNGKSHLIASST